MAQELRHIGKDIPRIKAREFVTGRAEFIRDMKRPGMLYGKALRSPHAHAKIKNIDTSKAEKLKGVETVLTHKNAPNWISGLPFFPYAPMLDSKVRYAGDAVALVAAKTEAIAEDALDLIAVTYEPLPAVFDMEDALKPGAPQLYSKFPGNFVPNELIQKTTQDIIDLDLGDTEKGFKEADFIVEGETHIENAQNPLPPEGPGVIAEWEGAKLTEWGAFSSPGMAESFNRNFFGLAPGDLRIIAACVGGSYGSKHIVGNNQIMLYAGALAKVVRRPVAMFYSREEHLAAFQVRLPARARYKIGIKKDGTVTAITGEWLTDSGAFSSLQGLMLGVGLITFPILAKCSNVKVDSKIIMTNNIPSGPHRGFGYLENTALFTPILAMAMEKAGVDPVEYYKKNCIKPGDQFFHAYMGHGMLTSAGPDIAPAIQKGAELFGWKSKWKGWGKPTEVKGNKIRSVGMGLAGMTDVGEQESTGSVQLNAFGSVTVYCGATEFGTGVRDVVQRIVAEALDLPLERINLTPPDTLVGPWEWGSTGSRSTYAIGTAVLAAAEDAKKKLFQRAAPMLQARPEDLGTKDGMIYVKRRKGQMLPWIAAMGWQGSINGTGHFPGRYNVNCYQAQFVEIELDVETGRVSMQKLTSATDCGKIINPLGFQGQLQGFHAGVDLALMEETVVDQASGRMLNPNMIDYKTRTFPELPEHDFVVLETPPNADPACPFGAFGAGEPSVSPAIPAVWMAIYNATGKKFFEYPITPEKILKALGKA